MIAQQAAIFTGVYSYGSLNWFSTVPVLLVYYFICFNIFLSFSLTSFLFL